MKDAKMITTKAFPAAGASNSHNGIDLLEGAPGIQTIVPRQVELLVEWPALPALVDAKTVIFTVEDSADNVTFLALAGITKTLTGAGGVGVAAGSFQVRLPGNTRRYVRVSQAVLAAGGDSTALSSTVSAIAI